MLSNPRINQAVVVWYRKSIAANMPRHGQAGRVVIVSRGKPRNHGVEIAGQLVVVPAGNLNPG